MHAVTKRATAAAADASSTSRSEVLGHLGALAEGHAVCTRNSPE